MPDGKSPVRPTAQNPTTQDAGFSEHGSHAYPRDLAQAVHGRCQEVLIGTGIHLTLPAPAQLEEVLSVCYQASLLREVRAPSDLSGGLGRPGGLSAGGGATGRFASSRVWRFATI
jgi:hypothetical protein